MLRGQNPCENPPVDDVDIFQSADEGASSPKRAQIDDNPPLDNVRSSAGLGSTFAPPRSFGGKNHAPIREENEGNNVEMHQAVSSK